MPDGELLERSVARLGEAAQLLAILRLYVIVKASINHSDLEDRFDARATRLINLLPVGGANRMDHNHHHAGLKANECGCV